MKTLLMSIFCTFICASLFAQVDSTNNTNTPQTTPPPTMNTTNNSDMNATATNGQANLVNPDNIPGEADYAALPVMETFVPDNIVSEVKQKYPNDVIYDITAVKAPVDSAEMMQNSMNENATAMNQDSSMNMNQNSTAMNDQNSTMNQNNNTDQNSTMNQNTTDNNDMAMNSAKTPEKYNYVVRVLQGGQMVSETLESDGTAMLKSATSSINNEINQ